MLLPALIVLAMVMVGVGVLVVTRRPTHLPQHADRGLRHDRLVHALALVAAVLTAVGGGLWAVQAPTLRGELAIPLAEVFGAGFGYLAVQAVGQWAWPRPSGPTRRAGLVPRDFGDLTGPRGSRLVVVPLTVVVLAVVLPAVSAPLDGPSAGTRQLYRAGWDEASGAVVTLRDVLGLGWPGLRYGFPVLLATLALLAVAGLALRAVADRPTVTDGGTSWDQTTRSMVARRVITVTAGVLAAAGGILVLAAGSRLMETGTGVVVPVGAVLLVTGTGWSAGGVVLAAVGALRPLGSHRRSNGLAASGARA